MVTKNQNSGSRPKQGTEKAKGKNSKKASNKVKQPTAYQKDRIAHKNTPKRKHQRNPLQETSNHI